MESKFYISCTFIFCSVKWSQKLIELFKSLDFIVHVFEDTHEQLLYKQRGAEKLGSEHVFTPSKKGPFSHISTFKCFIRQLLY